MLLELRKYHETTDRGRLLQTMEGYRVDTKMRGILEEFSGNQEVATRKIGHHEPHLWGTHGKTQGGMV